jgi:chromosome segregation ATPase
VQNTQLALEQDALRTRIKRTEDEAQRQEAARVSLQHELGATREEVIRWKARCESSSQMIKEREDRIVQLQRQMNKLMQNDKDAEVKHLTAEIVGLRQQLHASNEYNQGLHSSVQDLKKKCVSLGATLASLSSTEDSRRSTPTSAVLTFTH